MCLPDSSHYILETKKKKVLRRERRKELTEFIYVIFL